MGNDLGVFEAMDNAGKLSAEAAANSGFELEKAIDRAIFRAKERFGAYLANSQSKDDFSERWAEVKAKGLLNVVAEVTPPTPGVLRKVEAALRPPVPKATTQAKRARLSPSVKTAGASEDRRTDIPDLPTALKTASVQKTAWAFDQSTNLYTSNDPMQKFACPGCGHEQDSLGFTKCACGRQWNSWPVRQAGSAKTGSSYVLMAREIKMRGDQFKLAAEGNVKVAAEPVIEKVAGPMDPPPGMSQPSFGTMPGDNSGAVGEPVPPQQPPTPGGDLDGDGDIAGGVTEGSPIDQIQDALQDAIVALKDVQMLSVNPQLAAMGGLKLSTLAAAKAKGAKVDKLRTSMDRFWELHKQMNYVAGMLAKEANEAIRTVDPRITSEAEFVKGYYAAAKNEPLPAKTGKAYLEGYVAFHTQADTYSDGANTGGLFKDTPDGESPGAHDDGTWTDGGAAEANEIRGDAGPFDTSQPASRAMADKLDRDNAAGGRDRGQGQSGSIQPTGSRRSLPKGR